VATSRYRESRTLVRRLVRLPGEDRAQFRAKLSLLREHFERFNVDTSDLCQWLMGLRRQRPDPEHPQRFGPLGDFLLEPALDSESPDESRRDAWRLHVFDAVAGIRPLTSLDGRPLPDHLRRAIEEVSALPRTRSAQRLFERMREVEPGHRLVLLKAAAEWIVARYQRGVENWVRQREEWAREKDEWERRHPALTPDIRERFTAIFRRLADPERPGRTGLRRKNPRLCPYDRLKLNIDNCIYAGQKGHAPLCWKYDKFVQALRGDSKPPYTPDRFWEDANRFLQLCRENKNRWQTDQPLQSPNLPDLLYRTEQVPQKRRDLFQRFKTCWQRYLRHMGLTAENVVRRGELPHCPKIGKTHEQSDCRWNPHTDLCRQYRSELTGLNGLDEQTLQQERTYREWRKLYLAGPRKPSFKYPSARDLPMPKIFGRDFYQLDLERSVLRLRLEGMPASEWLEFGMTPWPRDYSPTRTQVADRITSVHVNFVGTRARVGLRFGVPHAASKFGCTQDQLDELRSRVYPRAAQDAQFVRAARDLLLSPLTDERREQVRVLAVDLGETGAHAAVYEGRRFQADCALKINKIDRLYETPAQRSTSTPRQDQAPQATSVPGLNTNHLARHFARAAESAQDIAQHRLGSPPPPDSSRPPVATFAPHDLLGLKRHVRWMIRDWVRLNARQVIQTAREHRCDLIVFESLRGNRLPGYDQVGSEAERKKLARTLFAYGQVRRKVTEKAVELGMRVVTVPDFKSSQVCSECGHVQLNVGRWRKNKMQGKFSCECTECTEADTARTPRQPARSPTPASQAPQRPGGMAVNPSTTRPCICRNKRMNSDLNAAKVLARVFWGEIELPPRDTSVRCGP
jgi:hypothetical protein